MLHLTPFLDLISYTRLVVASFANATVTDVPLIGRRQFVAFFLQPFRGLLAAQTPLSGSPVGPGRPAPAGQGRRGGVSGIYLYRSGAAVGRAGHLPIWGCWEAPGRDGPGPARPTRTRGPAGLCRARLALGGFDVGRGAAAGPPVFGMLRPLCSHPSTWFFSGFGPSFYS